MLGSLNTLSWSHVSSFSWVPGNGLTMGKRESTWVFFVCTICAVCAGIFRFYETAGMAASLQRMMPLTQRRLEIRRCLWPFSGIHPKSFPSMTSYPITHLKNTINWSISHKYWALNTIWLKPWSTERFFGTISNRIFDKCKNRMILETQGCFTATSRTFGDVTFQGLC